MKSNDASSVLCWSLFCQEGKERTGSHWSTESLLDQQMWICVDKLWKWERWTQVGMTAESSLSFNLDTETRDKSKAQWPRTIYWSHDITQFYKPLDFNMPFACYQNRLKHPFSAIPQEVAEATMRCPSDAHWKAHPCEEQRDKMHTHQRKQASEVDF